MDCGARPRRRHATLSGLAGKATTLVRTKTAQIH